MIKLNLDFIGIGAPKSGTTWLATILREHPEAFIPEGEELSYFNDKVPYFECIFNNRSKGLAWYEKQFASALPMQKKGEFSNVYMYDLMSCKRIKDFAPDVKLIVSLRNPVKMIYSQFWYMKSSISCGLQASVPEELFTNPDLKNFLEMGKFGALLQPYFDLFEKENIHVVFFDDLAASPETTARDLYTFLGIDPIFIPDSLKKKVNEARVSKSERLKKICGSGLAGLQKIGLGSIAEALITNKALAKLYGKVNYRKGYPPISLGLQNRLSAYYAQDIINLQSLLGRKIDWE